MPLCRNARALGDEANEFMGKSRIRRKKHRSGTHWGRKAGGRLPRQKGSFEPTALAFMSRRVVLQV